jgi:hypothetical protein
LARINGNDGRTDGLMLLGLDTGVHLHGVASNITKNQQTTTFAKSMPNPCYRITRCPDRVMQVGTI